MLKSDLKRGIIVGLLISFAALSRLIDHPMNFTPMAAILLFSAACISNKYLRIIAPFVTILFSDLILQLINGQGFHSGSWVVYMGYLLIFLIGKFVFTRVNVVRTFSASVLGSISFYLLTNFAFFYPESPISNPTLGQYPHNFAGVIGSYNAGLPFFSNMLVGDLVYSSLIFGTYYLLANFNKAFAKAN